MDTMLLAWADCPQHDRPQIDLHICEKVKKLVEDGYTSKDLREVIEQIIIESSASDFAVHALGMIYNQVLEKERIEELADKLVADE